MLHVLRQHEIEEATRHKLHAEAIHVANAPFHILEGKGLSVYREFLDRMDSVIDPPPFSADPLADAELASFEMHMRLAGAA